MILGVSCIMPADGVLLNPASWHKICGFAVGLGGAGYIAFRMLFRAKSTEERLMLSILLYTFIGMFVEGGFGVGGSLE